MASTTLEQDHILIIGAGVFGLSTALALLENPDYDDCQITIIDPYSPTSQEYSKGKNEHQPIPASHDSSRIVRADYASAPYARLASEASAKWRKRWPNERQTTTSTEIDGNQQSYFENGLLLVDDSDEKIKSTGKSGKSYIQHSYDNVRSIEAEIGASSDSRSRIEYLPDGRSIQNALRIQGISEQDADGYINHSSGFADASLAMAQLARRVMLVGKNRSHPLVWHASEVERLCFDAKDQSNCVTGATLKDGTTMSATVTILATGAWTPRFIPLSSHSILRASGQVLGYVKLTEQEADLLEKMPVMLNLGKREFGGMFVIPPKPNIGLETQRYFKIARHGWGYAYPVDVTSTEPEGGSVNVYIPAQESSFTIPREGREALRRYLASIFEKDSQTLYPSIHAAISSDKPFDIERTCWYTDTPNGDYLIDWCPGYGPKPSRDGRSWQGSLLVATGGSGHAFKMVPVIGEYIVKRLEGKLESTDTPNSIDSDLAKLWSWDTAVASKDSTDSDGSRGGPKGMLWTEEIAK